jgi:aspartate/methionine/tyrosine aminotransferase
MFAAFKQYDHVIVHSPGYQSLADVARAAGCDVSPWMAREQNGWALDLNELRHLMRSNTKAIIINTPHNPTGYLMSREDYDALHNSRRKTICCSFPMRSIANPNMTPPPASRRPVTTAIMPFHWV